jgi:hypothetical protein
VCDGRVRAVHSRSAVIGDRWAYYGTRNRLWFVRRHFSRGALIAAILDAGWLTARYVASAALRGRSRHLMLWHLRGYRDGLRAGPSVEEGPWPAEPVVGGAK